MCAGGVARVAGRTQGQVRVLCRLTWRAAGREGRDSGFRVACRTHGHCQKLEILASRDLRELVRGGGVCGDKGLPRVQRKGIKRAAAGAGGRDCEKAF